MAKNIKALASKNRSLQRGWGPALYGLMLMVVATPAVAINHSSVAVPPLQITQQVSSAGIVKVSKKYCLPGENHSNFDLALHNKSRAVMMRFSQVATVPKPIPRPAFDIWIASVSRKVTNRTDEMVKATKKATRNLFDLTKRKVSGNGQRMILENRTAKLFIELERRWGEKLEVRWAYRDSKLNKKVGGKSQSLHLQKKAVDIVHNGWSKTKMRRFVRLAHSLGFRGFGMGRNVIHIDTRGALTSWNYGGNIYGLAYSMVK